MKTAIAALFPEIGLDYFVVERFFVQRRLADKLFANWLFVETLFGRSLVGNRLDMPSKRSLQQQLKHQCVEGSYLVLATLYR